MNDELYSLKFPIGEYHAPEIIDDTSIYQWIDEIESFPFKLEKLTKNLSIIEMYWKYRPDGWMIKQVVHHCADSHMNSFIRFKLALTEDNPTIRPYFEDRWAELPDGKLDNTSASIELLKGLHARWATLLRNLTSEELEITFIHPEQGKIFTLKETIGNYAWHGRHHLAHIQQAIDSEGGYNG